MDVVGAEIEIAVSDLNTDTTGQSSSVLFE